jgi:tetratricopeptide (TPR) repeat protein
MENNLFTEQSAIVPTYNDKTDADMLAHAYKLYELGQYKEAISYAEKNPVVSSSAYGRVLLGNCFKQISDYQTAMSHWKKAIEISPLEHNAYINIANYLYSTNKLNEAIHNWTIASTIVPENATLNLNLALAYDKKGNRIKATKYFEKYIKYEKKINCNEYVMIKNKFANLMAKIDFYSKKVEEYKLQKDLKTIAALYLKMISTYALLPSIYTNIAEIFNFDRNFEKAFEFYQIVYLNFPFTRAILLEMANICYTQQKYSYAYSYYSKVKEMIPENTSQYNKIENILNSMATILTDPEIIDEHLAKAEAAVADCDYETAIDEYENYLILKQSEDDDIKQLIDKYKIYVNPESFVINLLYAQIPELMSKKKLNTCIEVCDRIIAMAKDHSKEVVTAIKYKSECKRILIAREQFGV